jgi:hypothetical protein
MTRIKALLLLISAGVSCNLSVGQGLTKIFFRDAHDFRRLFLYDTASHSTRKIYETPPQFIFSKLKPSPTKSLVAILECNTEHMRPGDVGYATQNLALIDTNGSVIRIVKDVLDYAWSPSGDSIAFIRGYNYGGDEIKPHGVWIVSVPYSSQQEVQVSQEKAFDLNWSMHDNMIYAVWRDIHKIDPVKKTSVKTELKGIYFSDDGTYYFSPNYEGAGFKLFETRTNRQIALPTIAERKVNFYSWLSGKRLVVGNIYGEKKVIEVDQGTTKKTTDGELVGYDMRTDEVYVRTGRKVRKDSGEPNVKAIKLRN